MFVVSRNYRYRASECRWLVRGPGETNDQARACRAVVAQGVSFEDARDHGVPDACVTVAACESAQGFGWEGEEWQPPELPSEADGLSPLRFTGVYFRDAEERIVSRCERLVLGERVLAGGIDEPAEGPVAA